MDVNVLVVFYSRYGTTEQLALAAGLGAIQSRANIRLRRVADRAEASAIESSVMWRQNVERMNRDYVAPRPADPVWADVIILATPADGSTEIEEYVSSLPSLGSMRGKIAAPLGPPNSDASLRRLYAAAGGAGMIVAPAQIDSDDVLEDCRAYGRRVSDMARTLKGDPD